MDTPIVSSLGPEPWNAPWWKPAKGDGATFFYIMSIHLLALAGIILFPLPGWRLFVTTFVLLFLGGLGVTVGFHRALAHGALRLHPVIRHALIFFAMLGGSGAPASWTANHRQHHSRVETPEDISSPWIGGFWWSHLRWLWQAGNVPVQRWSPDLGTPEYTFWSRVQLPVMALALFGGTPFGWAAFFWLGPIRLVYALHAQCFVNSIAHMRGDRKEGEDSSQNLVWLGFVHMLQGENWHGNHHAQPGSARFGWRFWQIDFGWYIIVLLEKLRLAYNVKRPTFREMTRVAVPSTDEDALVGEF